MTDEQWAAVRAYRAQADTRAEHPHAFAEPEDLPQEIWDALMTHELGKLQRAQEGFTQAERTSLVWSPAREWERLKDKYVDKPQTGEKTMTSTKTHMDLLSQSAPPRTVETILNGSHRVVALDPNQFFHNCYKCAVDHGWWDNETRELDELLAEKLLLVLTEAREAVQEGEPLYRNPEKPDKPEGYLPEYADIIIRLADLCGHAGVLTDWPYTMGEHYKIDAIDGELWLSTNNPVDYSQEPTRLYVPCVVLCSVGQVYEMVRDHKPYRAELANLLYGLYEFFINLDSRMKSVLQLKYEYNLTRPWRHGGKKV